MRTRRPSLPPEGRRVILKPETIIMAAPKTGHFYRHYKGGLYYVVALAKHTERDETLVIYRHVSGSMHARPLDEWNKPAKIEIGADRDIMDTRSRFELERFALIPGCFKMFPPEQYGKGPE